MAKSDRTGMRKTRDQRGVRRNHELGYYYNVTDTEATERCYFYGLRNSLPDDMKSKLVIKVVQTKTKNLIEKCRELVAYEPHFGVPWIVFDRDQVKDFDKIIQQAEQEGINVAWSNPCFEIWLDTSGISMLFIILGIVAAVLQTLIKKRQVKIIQKQMKSCMKN